jgi:hypothetical protein
MVAEDADLAPDLGQLPVIVRIEEGDQIGSGLVDPQVPS